jgi:hypothetical protein
MAKKKLNHLMFLKIFNFSLFLSISTLIFPCPSYSNESLLGENNRENQAENSLEKTIMQEINLARTNPIAYADLLENLFLANITPQKKDWALVAIDFLRSLNPLPELNLSNDLSQIASQVVNDNNSSNYDNYRVIDISIPPHQETKEILIELFDRNSSKETIFTQAIRTTGIACNAFKQKCVIITEATSNNDQQNQTSIPSESNSNPTEIAATQKYNLLEKGVLKEGDPVIPSDGSLYDAYIWEGKQGDSLIISLESEDFDSYLAVQSPQGQIIAENDDFSSENSNSGLKVILPSNGVYRIIVNSYDPKGRGDYIITVTKE